MTAYGFKDRFGPLIIQKSKTQTMRKIRKDNRTPPVGGELQLFTGMRTKNCVRLGTATVKAVYPIKIDWVHSWVDVSMMAGKKPYRLNCNDGSEVELDPFAVSDGFEDWEKLWEFFTEGKSGAPNFEGNLIIWGDTFEAAVLS